MSDFKGKIIYIDVWATWCGPCVTEIPSTIEFQKSLQGNNDVVFLNVSVDKNVEAWKNKVIKEKEWEGIHIILNRKQYDSLAINYRLVGIPQYILIDQNGIIANAKAPRPSSPKALKEEIGKLSK